MSLFLVGSSLIQVSFHRSPRNPATALSRPLESLFDRFGLNRVWFMESFEQGRPNDSHRNFYGSAVEANEDEEKDFLKITAEVRELVCIHME